MNIDALMSHVSRHLHTIVRQYSKDFVLLKQICERSISHGTDTAPWDDQLAQHPEIIARLLSDSELSMPKVFSGADYIAYLALAGEDCIFLVGPVQLNDEIGYMHRFDSPSYESNWLLSLYSCNLLEFITEALLLHNLFHPLSLKATQVAAANCLNEQINFEVQKKFTDIVVNNQENYQQHNPYEQEVREISAIRNGDLKQLEESISEDYVGTVGTLAQSKMRSFQNLAIVIITLASRAAIEGGVIPEVAYSLSDSYIQKIEQLHIPEAAISLARQAEKQYTTMVFEIKQMRRSPARISSSDYLVNRCKNYIFLHLQEKVSTAQIAQAIYVNPNYLSGLFKQKEGLSITEYILKEKIRMAKSMLIYSPYSYSRIASHLGFSSQSHLGSQFKKHTGMTLRQYRINYQKTEQF